jgi:hypothetical protein
VACPLRLVEAPPNLGPDPDIIGYNITFKKVDNIANPVVPSAYYYCTRLGLSRHSVVRSIRVPLFFFFFPSDVNPAV